MNRPAVVDLDDATPAGTERVVTRATSLRPSTRVQAWRANSPSSFNVAVVEPAAGAHAEDCVVPMSHDYRIDRMMLRRLEVLADVTGCRVIGVETPGITMSPWSPATTQPSHVDRGVVRRVLRGDFTGIASLQASALRDVAGVSIADARIVGESLGAQLGASLAAGAETVRSLDIIEPVNARPLTLLKLLRLQKALTGVEADRKAAYVLRNETNGWGDFGPFELSSPMNARIDRRLKAFHRQGRYASATAIGLWRGLQSTLTHVGADTAIRLWVADASHASRSSDAEWLAARLGGQIAAPRVLVLRASQSWPQALGHHALTDLSLMESFARELRRAWQQDDATIG